MARALTAATRQYERIANVRTASARVSSAAVKAPCGARQAGRGARRVARGAWSVGTGRSPAESAVFRFLDFSISAFLISSSPHVLGRYPFTDRMVHLIAKKSPRAYPQMFRVHIDHGSVVPNAQG